jgi:basic amino acid/polyamine antiporter, APA family
LTNQVPPRAYGFWTGTFVVTASMVGSGILLGPGHTLQATESPWALMILWTIGGAMALAGSWVVAELGASLPHAGGDYVFVRQAFGNAWAFVFGWSCLLFTFAGPIALISLMTVQYVAPVSFDTSSLWAYAFATGIILLFTALHGLGQRESAFVQNLTTIIKLAIFLAFAVAGFGWGEGHFSHFDDGLPIAQKGGWSTLAINLTYVLYAYSGWNGAAYLAGEIRDPQRTLPRSLVAGSLLVMGLYLLMNALYVFALPMETIRSASEKDINKVAWMAGEALFGGNVSRMLSVVFGIGMLATISALLFTGPRIAYMMARDGLLPATIAWISPRGQTPVFSTMLLGTVSLAILWSGTFNAILDFTAVGLTTLSALTVASIFPLRARENWPNKYRMPMYPLPPIIFLALTAFIVVLALQSGTEKEFLRWQDTIIPVNAVALGSILAMLLGFPLYAVYVLFAGKPSTVIDLAEAGPMSEPSP